MGKINRIIRKELFWPSIGAALVTLALCICSAYFFFGAKTVSFLTCTRSVSNTDVKDLKEKEFVRFNTNELIDSYEYFNKENGYAYIMPFEDELGNTKYIGLMVTDKAVDKADRIVRGHKELRLSGSAVIWDMSSDEVEWFEEALDVNSVSYSEKQIVTKMLQYIPTAQVLKKSSIYGLVFTPLFLIITIVLLYTAVKRLFNKDVKNFIEEYSIDPRDLEVDLGDATSYANTYLGRRFALYVRDGRVAIVEYSNIDRMGITTRRMNVQGTYKTIFCVYYITKDNKRVTINTDGKPAADNLLLRFCENNPQIIVDNK